MRLALGHFHWPPEMFWAATPHELQAAIEALPGNTPDDQALTWDEFEDLKLRLGID